MKVRCWLSAAATLKRALVTRRQTRPLSACCGNSSRNMRSSDDASSDDKRVDATYNWTSSDGAMLGAHPFIHLRIHFFAALAVVRALSCLPAHTLITRTQLNSTHNPQPRFVRCCHARGISRCRTTHHSIIAVRMAHCHRHRAIMSSASLCVLDLSVHNSPPVPDEALSSGRYSAFAFHLSRYAVGLTDLR